jgi:hypothetical protein
VCQKSIWGDALGLKYKPTVRFALSVEKQASAGMGRPEKVLIYCGGQAERKILEKNWCNCLSGPLLKQFYFLPINGFTTNNNKNFYFGLGMVWAWFGRHSYVKD